MTQGSRRYSISGLTSLAYSGLDRYLPREYSPLYVNADPEDLHSHPSTYDAPFNILDEKELCPGQGMLENINAVLQLGGFLRERRIKVASAFAISRAIARRLGCQSSGRSHWFEAWR